MDNIFRPFAIAWPDIAAVEHYVDIRGTLEKAGKVISQHDLWIAAITRAVFLGGEDKGGDGTE